MQLIKWPDIEGTHNYFYYYYYYYYWYLVISILCHANKITFITWVA